MAGEHRNERCHPSEVARAFYWQHLLDTGVMQSGLAIARAEKLHQSVVNELLRLTLLAPDIIEQFMAGTQRRRLNLIWFQRHPLMVPSGSHQSTTSVLESSRGVKRTERPERPETARNRPVAGWHVQEVTAGNCASIGVSGKKKPNRERLGFG